MPLKRLSDIFLAVVMLALVVWFFPIVALMIKRDSAGPIFFKQERVGKNEKLFYCIKLRTMHVGTKNLGTHEVSSTAITNFGRVLRRVKLDELPQLWNVLRGEMSFVGPRPSLPTQTKILSERNKRGIMTVIPGISGLAQIHYVNMSQPRRLASYDALYMRRASFCMDMYIVFNTILMSLKRIHQG